MAPGPPAPARCEHGSSRCTWPPPRRAPTPGVSGAGGGCPWAPGVCPATPASVGHTPPRTEDVQTRAGVPCASIRRRSCGPRACPVVAAEPCTPAGRCRQGTTSVVAWFSDSADRRVNMSCTTSYCSWSAMMDCGVVGIVVVSGLKGKRKPREYRINNNKVAAAKKNNNKGEAEANVVTRPAFTRSDNDPVG